MKKLLRSAPLLAWLAGTALAADLPSHKAPVIVPPPSIWTGFYTGLNAGGTWSGNNTTRSVGWGLFDNPYYLLAQGVNDNAARIYPGQTFATGKLAGLTATGDFRGGNDVGFFGGGQIGYNWQIGDIIGLGPGSGFVTGIEADIQGIAGDSGPGNFRAAASSPKFGDAGAPNNSFVATTFGTAEKRIQYMGTVRGRLGILATPTLMLYGTGGLAYGGVNLNIRYATVDTGNPWVDHSNVAHPFGGGFGSINYANTQVGWTAGGGFEWMFLPNWSARAEYLYYDLGTVQGSTVVSGVTNTLGGASPYSPTGYAYVANASTRFNGNIVRTGVNYHFNWGSAAVVANY